MGRFEFRRLFGRNLIYARDPKGNLAGYATLADEDGTEVAIVLGPAAIARGRVVDSSGKPRGGMQVFYSTLFHVARPDALARASQTVETDDEGKFTAKGLLIGAGAICTSTTPPAAVPAIVTST